MIQHSIWNNLCQQPTLAATYGHYGKLVSDSTTKLQQCVQGMLTMLYDRAIGLTRCANFDAALRDATAIQELAPLSALGYLCAADIYSQQGRQQAVIRICNEALDVVHNKDPDYVKLQRVKMDAKQRDAIRLDIISRLPLDIAVHVLFPMVIGDEELLDSIKLCPYLNVSKAWRDCVVQACPGGLCFKLDNENSTSCIQVTRFARYTSSLHLGSYSHGKWLSDLLLSGNMCTLKEIKIENLGPAIDVDHLVSSLQSVSNTLTHLTIASSFSDEIVEYPHRKLRIQSLSVARILTHCPNLVSLDIDHDYDANFSTVPITTTWPKLTALRLYEDRSGISNDMFLEILKRFPSLTKLALDPCIGIQPSIMIHHYCPSLRDLDLITDDSMPIHLRQSGYQQQHHDKRITGVLEKLSVLDRSGDTDPPEEVCEMLKQHHRTLIDLQLGFDYTDSTDEDFCNLEYPCLETLKLACSVEASACFGWWIVEKAPSLEELSITAFAIGSTPRLLEIQPPFSLKKLVLNLFGEDQLEEPANADVFLDQFTQLKELNITLNADIDNTSTFAAICRLPKLEHLELCFLPDWSPNDMDTFLDMLIQGCPHLKSLEMECETSPSLYSIRIIKRFVDLQHIGFAVNDTTEYCILLSSLMTLPNLNSVRIYQDTTLAHEFGNHLAYFRSDIKFVIGKTTRVGTLNF